MKKFSVMLLALLMLTSCGTIDTTTSVGDSTEIEEESSIGISEEITTIGTSTDTYTPSKISDYDISDFEFSAYYFDYYGSSVHQPTLNKYRGVIQDEDIKTQLWNIVCTQEMQYQYDGGSVGGSDCAELYLTNKTTGETFEIYYSIWYQNPELEGGPIVMVINNNYYSITPNECSSIDNDFQLLIEEAIMSDENLITIDENNTISTLNKNDRRTEIILINQYTNWAWGYQNYGYFVTMYGDVYEFDFSNYDEYMFPNEKTDFLSYLEDIMENGEISHFEDVSKIIEPLQNIEKTNSWQSISYGCDMGQNTLYGVRPNDNNSDMEIIKLYSYGDNIEILQDDNAKKICEIWLDDQFIVN